ncbi:GatB/YqeY domain-containing protein [Candidatus Parcubacteria bacterium]|nr:MAG: GatB/YqeY domain-containing protein [Candidatus Parcubacteria bacterium]
MYNDSANNLLFMLYKQIQDDLKTAMKEKDLQTVEVLRLLWSSLKNKAIEMKRELEDAEVIAVIKSDAKKIEDSMRSFIDGKREDLAEKARNELIILKQYLPPEMSDEELKQKINDILTPELTKDFGRAMGKVMSELKGLVDGGRVRKMLEAILSEKQN